MKAALPNFFIYLSSENVINKNTMMKQTPSGPKVKTD